MKFANLLVLASLCSLPLGAAAQWQWIDKNNKKVFSDTAPPPDIAEKNILRRPGPGSPPRAVSAEAASPAASVPAPAAAKPAGVDKDLEEKTRKADADEKARKEAETRKVAQAKADNCSRARQGKATFDSGIRVARVNAQGEREILDDRTRADEQRRLQSVIDSDCAK